MQVLLQCEMLQQKRHMLNCLIYCLLLIFVVRNFEYYFVGKKKIVPLHSRFEVFDGDFGNGVR